MPSVRRIENSVTAETTHTLWSAQMAAACAPAPVAPTVWAMVLSVRMAASGRSTSALRALSRSAVLGSDSSMAPM